MSKLLCVAALMIAGLLALPAVLATAVVAPTAGTAASRTALQEIPPRLLEVYQQAVTDHCPGLDWTVLAAVGRIESNHADWGRRLQPDLSTWPQIVGPVLDGAAGTRRILDTDGGSLDGDPVYDRAVGPMQFIPSTWSAYGIDATGSGFADPHHAVDAAHTAAAYLCANGAGTASRLRQAIWRYNNSMAYVDQVMKQAADYATYILAADEEALAAAVLGHPSLDIYAGGREDIARGRIDPRVLRLLLELAERYERVSVSSLITGHSRCIGGGDYPGCRESHHWNGRAVDIWRIDNALVSADSPLAVELVDWLGQLSGELRPSEVGSPFSSYTPLPGFFTDEAHQRHIHVAYGMVSP